MLENIIGWEWKLKFLSIPGRSAFFSLSIRCVGIESSQAAGKDLFSIKCC
uniref:Uncharacterized protein n=1 Tax=Rhizophora mucronata TaxID=61149 RepID=A0A2P2P064_RHIMU